MVSNLHPGAHAPHRGDHCLADDGPIEWRVVAIEIGHGHTVEALDAIVIGFCFVEHVAYRIEAVLQRQRLHSVAGCFVLEIDTEAVRHYSAQTNDAVVRHLAEDRLQLALHIVASEPKKYLVVKGIVAALDAERGDRKPGVVHAR
jgi:hypothetical protein